MWFSFIHSSILRLDDKVLGAAMFYVRVGEESVVYTGSLFFITHQNEMIFFCCNAVLPSQLDNTHTHTHTHTHTLFKNYCFVSFVFLVLL